MMLVVLSAEVFHYYTLHHKWSTLFPLKKEYEVVLLVGFRTDWISTNSGAFLSVSELLPEVEELELLLEPLWFAQLPRKMLIIIIENRKFREIDFICLPLSQSGGVMEFRNTEAVKKFLSLKNQN